MTLPSDETFYRRAQDVSFILLRLLTDSIYNSFPVLEEFSLCLPLETEA